jgi:hypothetical protein
MRMQARIVAVALAAGVALGGMVASIHPRTVEAQAKPSGPLPRVASGKPDLSGIWQTLSTAAWDLEDHSAAADVPGGLSVVDGGDIPYHPWALKKKQENSANRAKLDPLAQCYMPGVPRATYMPFPFEIVQTPTHVGLFYEYVHSVRMAYLDGSKHPEALDFWMGDSRARWDGDTLVVDVKNLNDQTWFDKAGNFHSEEMHVVERYAMTSPNHIAYEATITDPKVFTRPWKISMPLYRRLEKNVQLLDYECFGLTEASPTLEDYKGLSK